MGDGYRIPSSQKLTAKSSVSLSLECCFFNPVITALSSNRSKVSEVSESRVRRRHNEGYYFSPSVVHSALLRCFRCRPPPPPPPPFHISLPVPSLLFISLSAAAPVTEFKRFCMTYMRQKHCSRHAAQGRARSILLRLSPNKVSVDSCQLKHVVLFLVKARDANLGLAFCCLISSAILG